MLAFHGPNLRGAATELAGTESWEADRGLINPTWIAKFSTWITHLNRFGSDHAPLFVKVETIAPSSSAFKFINARTKNHMFMKVIEESWRQPQVGRPMTPFAQKFKALRKALLQVRNKNVFGNLNHVVKLAEDKVMKAEIDYDSLPSEYNKKNLCLAKQALNES